MLDIAQKKNRSFQNLRDYYQNIRNVVSKNPNGNFTDPFGNIIHSFKLDELGNLIGLAMSAKDGISYSITLFGNPDKIFEVQGYDYLDSYRYVFDKGYKIFEKQSNAQTYIRRQYSPRSEGRPVAETKIPHNGHFEERRWTDDGKILIRKKIRQMDNDCLEKITTEFLDKKGHPHLRIDWRQYGRYCQTEMYDLTQKGNKLQWLCEKDPKGNYCFYDGQGRLLNVVTNQNGKRQPISVPAPRNQVTR